jgi:hypothetical protein
MQRKKRSWWQKLKTKVNSKAAQKPGGKQGQGEAGIGGELLQDDLGEIPPEIKLSSSLQKNLDTLKQLLGESGDLNFREFKVGRNPGVGAAVFWLDGMADKKMIGDNVVKALAIGAEELIPPTGKVKPFFEELKERYLSVGDIKEVATLAEAVYAGLSGDTVFMLEGYPEAIIASTRGWAARGPEEPASEVVVKGPREGFTEIIQVNRALVRRRIPDPCLKIINYEIGRRSKTKVSLLYINDVCSMDLVREVEERLKAIDIDGILDPGAITELIVERTITPFPLLLSTERPDKVAGGLLQGKVVIMSDGSPFASIIPATAADFLQTPEDYYIHPLFATIGRLVRLVSIGLATTLTAAYTAVVMFHYEMIPNGIVTFIAQTREGVPFSPLTEAILLEFAVEIMREASIRLPGPVGPTLGIVGALILGQAAVDANLISPVLLIVVATGFLASSTMPNYEAALMIRYIRFPILFAAGFL